MNTSPLIISVFIYFFLITLIYILGAIALITWRLIIVPGTIYLIEKRNQRKAITNNLFYNQCKVLIEQI